MGKGWTSPFKDAVHIAYVDASQADDSPLGRFMHDFLCNRAEDMYEPLLKEKVRYYKETEKGVTIMSTYWEELLERDRKEGEAKGKAEGKGEMILNMIEDHDPLAKIMRISKWSADQIRALAAKNGLVVE